MYQILTEFLPNGQKVSGGQINQTIKCNSIPISLSSSDSLYWDTTNYGTGIIVTQGNTSVFLK